MRFEVTIGEDFGVKAVAVDTVETVRELSAVFDACRKTRMRERLTYGFLGSLGCALLVSALIGFRDGSFDEAGTVWALGAAPLGFVLRTYFDRQG
jgi:hypothetical protein